MGREKVENWSPLLHEYMHVQFDCLNYFSAFGMSLFLLLCHFLDRLCYLAVFLLLALHWMLFEYSEFQ